MGIIRFQQLRVVLETSDDALAQSLRHLLLDLRSYPRHADLHPQISDIE